MIQKAIPKVITILSLPQKHYVIYDGTTQFTGSTEIACERFLKKYVDSWPKMYPTFDSYGEGFTCNSVFSRQKGV